MHGTFEAPKFNLAIMYIHCDIKSLSVFSTYELCLYIVPLLSPLSVHAFITLLLCTYIHELVVLIGIVYNNYYGKLISNQIIILNFL